MSDDGHTPRGGRYKKKSALSKLAARKRPDDSDEADSDRDYRGRTRTRDIRFADTDLDNVGNYGKSRGSSYDKYETQSSFKNKSGSQYTDEDKYDHKYSSSHRSEGSTRDHRKYPVDADVEVRPSSRVGMHSSQAMSDSDEGIEMGPSKGSNYSSSGRNILSERSNLRKLEPIRKHDKDSDDDDKYSKRIAAKSRYKVEKQLSDQSLSHRDENGADGYGNLSDDQEFSGARNLSNKYRTTSPDRKYADLNGKKSYLSKYDEPNTKSNKYDESYTKSNKYNDEGYTKSNKYEESYTKSKGLYGRYKLGENSRGRDDDDDDEKLGDTATERDLQKEYESLLSSSRSRGFDYNKMDDKEKHEYMDRPTPLATRLSPVQKQRPVKKTGTSGSLGSGIFSSQDHPWSTAIQVGRGHDDEMSQGSISSNSSVVQLMTTKSARQRGFLMGTMTGGGSLMGQTELERIFPDRKIRLLVGTWNMCEMKSTPETIDDFLLPPEEEYVNHIYVIGTQESMSNRKEWEVKVQECLGPQHVLFHSAANGVLYLSIFMHRDLLWYCSEPQDGGVSTKVVKIKTKGAVAISFTIFGTSFLFINSHLSQSENSKIPETAHDGMAEQRCADYHKICSSLQFSDKESNISGKDYNVTDLYDTVFWLGDLNFRLEKERDRVHRKVEGIRASDIPTYEDLVETDELFRIRNMGAAFQHFQEGRINFRPTYKYDLDSDNYDTKKLRIPSYTDRVLFRTRKKNTVTCLHYDSVDSIKVSDHRPVYAQFEVTLRPGKDITNMNAGRFNREIYMAGTGRRAQHLETDPKVRLKGTQKSSKMCIIQ